MVVVLSDTPRRRRRQCRTFASRGERGSAKEKIDYLLLSPALQKRVEHVDVFRRGFYAPRKWEASNITGENKDRFQASDHHCVWAQLQA